jgi:tetratricopeptide (TPR) repeat protein
MMRESRVRSGRETIGLLALIALIWTLPGPPGAIARAEDDGQTQAESAIDVLDAELGMSRGVIQFERGHYAEALKEFGDPARASSGMLYYRGLSLLAAEQGKEALADLQKVRRLPGAPGEVEVDEAVARLATGDPAGAEGVLKDYLAKHPGDAYGQYFLGVARFRQRRYREAIDSFKLASAETTLAPYLDFYEGLSAYAQGDGRYRDLLARFEHSGAATDAPAGLIRQLNGMPTRPDALPGQAAGFARPTLNGVTGPPADRRWNLAFLSGYEYDTNVAIAPSIIPLGLGTNSHLRDSRWVVSSFGEYRLVQRDDWVLGLLESTYDSFQFNLFRYNIQDYMGGIYSNFSLAKDWILGIRYEFHETLLDGHQFITEHRLTPNLTYREGDFGHFTTFYEFNPITVTGLALIPAQNRSGPVNTVGATQAFYMFNGAGRFYLNYLYQTAKTLGTDFDRATNSVDARIEIPLPFKIVGNMEARYFWDDYRFPNSLDFFGRPRTDRRIEARVGAQKFLNDHLSIRVDYIYTDNQSNVRNLFDQSFYSYNRSLLSALMVYDF